MHLIGLVWRLFFSIVVFPLSSHATIYYSNEEHQLQLELAKQFPSVGMLSLQFISKYEEAEDNNYSIKPIARMELSCPAVLIDKQRVLASRECIPPSFGYELVLDTRAESLQSVFHVKKGISIGDATSWEIGEVLQPVFDSGSFIEKAKNKVLLGPLRDVKEFVVLYLKAPIKNVKNELLEGKVTLRFVEKNQIKKYSKQKRKLIHSQCSAVLIDPLTVLGLGECAKPLLEGYELDQNTNFFGANTFKLGDNVLTGPVAAQKVKAVLFYPGYKPDNELHNAQNIALFFLEKPIYNIEPALLFDEINYNFNQTFLNKKVALVGYGLHGRPWSQYLPKNDPHLPSTKEIDLYKRACWQKINKFERSTFETLFSLDGEKGFGMFTHGDQGGGMFLKHKDAWYLVGINSHRRGPKLPDEHLLDVGFETTGVTLALPSYIGWIKENQALRKVQSNGNADKSEWTFAPVWNLGVVPHNDVAKSVLYEATINSPSTIIVDNFISLEKLTLAHKQSALLIPQKLDVTLSYEEMEEFTKQLFEKGEKFQAVEYERSIIHGADKDKISRLLKVEARTIELQSGTLDVQGELWFNKFLIGGGEIRGKGEFIYGANPLVNAHATVTPGPLGGIGTLTLVGDYEQRSNTDKNIQGVLKIRVDKKGRVLTNSVLKVQGEAKLGGKLIIEEIGQPLAHNDRIKFVYGRASGKFDDIKLPAHFYPEIIYGQDYVTLVIKDKYYEQDVTLEESQNLAFERPKKIHSLAIHGGKFKAVSLHVAEGVLIDGGEFAVNEKSPKQMATIQGNYRQTGGNLVVNVTKRLRGFTDEQEFVMNEDGSLTLASEIPKHELAHKQISKIGNPDYEWTADRVKVKGDAHLGGTLTFKFDNEMLIKEGSKFTIFEADHLTGQFDDVTPFPCMVQPKLYYDYDEGRVDVEFVVEKKLSELKFKNLEARIAAAIYDREYHTERGHKKYSTLFWTLNGMTIDEIEYYLFHTVIINPKYQEMREHYQHDEEIMKIIREYEEDQSSGKQMSML